VKADPDAPDQPSTSPEAAGLYARRRVLGYSLSQAKASVPGLVAIGGVVAWLGLRAGVGVHAWVFLAWACGVALWRLAALARLGRHSDLPGAMQSMDVQALGRLEWQIQANMLVSGLGWAYATLTFHARMDAVSGSVLVMLVAANLASAAFLTAPVGRSFLLLALPPCAALEAVMLMRGDAVSLVVAALVVVFLASMWRGAGLLREVTMLAFEREHDMAVANDDLRAATREAEAAIRAKTRFLATMSHELRTPLNGLLGALDLLHHSVLAPREHRLVGLARTSGAGLLTVLDDVLDYARIDADQVSLNPQPIHPRELAESVVALFAASAHAKGLRLAARVGDTVPSRILADEQRLRQVLANLVGNAIKFTDHGSVELTVDRSSRSDDALRFEVRDTGIGIEAHDQSRLFAPFQQVHQGDSRRHGGTGLGLAISQRLVAAMGGRIELHSQPGQGSCFAFELALPASSPVAALEAPATAAQTPPAPAADARHAGRCVLLVDDNEVNRLLAYELLQLLDLTVRVANDGHEALAELEQGGIDLVLMDCQMPGLDGYEATRRWRDIERQRQLPRLPVVAMTANITEEDLDRARACGMDDELLKPYTFRQLEDLLRRLLIAPGKAGPEPAPGR